MPNRPRASAISHRTPKALSALRYTSAVRRSGMISAVVSLFQALSCSNCTSFAETGVSSSHAVTRVSISPMSRRASVPNSGAKSAAAARGPSAIFGRNKPLTKHRPHRRHHGGCRRSRAPAANRLAGRRISAQSRVRARPHLRPRLARLAKAPAERQKVIAHGRQRGVLDIGLKRYRRQFAMQHRRWSEKTRLRQICADFKRHTSNGTQRCIGRSKRPHRFSECKRILAQNDDRRAPTRRRVQAPARQSQTGLPSHPEVRNVPCASHRRSRRRVTWR